MRELSFHIPVAEIYPEDHWFKGAVVISLLLHGAVFMWPGQQAMDAASQASHQSIAVSLNLLMQQQKNLLSSTTKVREQTHKKPLAKQSPNKQVKTASTKPPSNNTAKQPPAHRSSKGIAPLLAEKVSRGNATQHVNTSEHFLAKLLTHIESYKYYPRVAQRRGIEGAVTVSFRLLPQGKIDRLRVTGAHLLLQKAAQAAVQQALPMLPAPAQMTLPYAVSFVMQFQLPAA